MKDKLNCPNCGAPITGIKCEYCGTQFFDFTSMELHKAGYMDLKINNKVHHFKATPLMAELKQFPHDSYALYADNEVVQELKPVDYFMLNISFKIVADENDVLMISYCPGEK